METRRIRIDITAIELLRFLVLLVTRDAPLILYFRVTMDIYFYNLLRALVDGIDNIRS